MSPFVVFIYNSSSKSNPNGMDFLIIMLNQASKLRSYPCKWLQMLAPKKFTNPNFSWIFYYLPTYLPTYLHTINIAHNIKHIYMFQSIQSCSFTTACYTRKRINFYNNFDLYNNNAGGEVRKTCTIFSLAVCTHKNVSQKVLHTFDVWLWRKVQRISCICVTKWVEIWNICLENRKILTKFKNLTT